MTHEVFIYKTSPYTLRQDVLKALTDSRLAEIYQKTIKTLIKINANYDRKYPGCNTSTWFLDALLYGLREIGFIDLYVIESDLKLQPTQGTIQAIGASQVLKKHGVQFLNLTNLPRDNDELPLLVNEAQLINVPVIHTHTFAVMSCACKNLFGLLPLYREKYHNELTNKLLELYKKLIACFTIVDGTVGLDGGSMRMGNPKRLDLIVTGWDLLSVDTCISKLMGFQIENVPLLRVAKDQGLLDELKIKGDFNDYDELPNFHFEYKESKLAKLDLWLRRNRITKHAFSYNSIPDRLANYVRKKFLSVNYSLKKNKIFDGEWVEYEKAYLKES